MSETQTQISPIVNERYEQEAAKHLTIEQKIQSDARGGVLKHLEGDQSLNTQQRDMLYSFADMAAKKALAEFEELKQKDPALAAEALISENQELFRDYYGLFRGNIDRIERARENVVNAARNIRAGDESGELTDEALLKKIGAQHVDIRMEEPSDPGKFDTNLAFLKALGAVPEDVTDLPKYLSEMPSLTSEDDLYQNDHGGEYQRAVRFSGMGGHSFRGLPTKIDGVQVSGARLYSTDKNGYGQWGFGLTFTERAVRRILEAKTVEKSHSN